MLHFLAIALLVSIALGISARGRGPVVERLGNVIYWSATGFAGSIFAYGVYVMIAGHPDAIRIALLAVAAVLTWCGGRAALYVLTRG